MIGIRHKLLLPGILAWSGFVLVLNLYWQPSYSSHQRALFVQRQEQNLRMLSTGLEEPLLRGDLAQIHAVLDKVLEDRRDWIQLTLHNAAGQRLFPLADPESAGSASLIQVSQSINNLDKEIAVITVAADPEAMLKATSEYIHQLNIVLITLLALAVLASTYMQDHLIRKPLRRMIDAAMRMAQGDFDIELPRTSRDEMGELSFALATMSSNLRLALDVLEEDADHARKSAAALQISEERFRGVFDNVADGIVIVDEAGTIQMVNPSLLSMFGFEHHDLLSQPVNKLIPTSERASHPSSAPPRADNSTNKLVAVGTGELLAQHKDGRQIPVAIVVSEMSVAGERLFIGVMRDISAKKRAELEREQLQKQLQQSQKMQAIGQLTGGIAHDFNNILASVMGYCELAMQKARNHNDTKLAQYLDEIHHAGGRARDLIAQMLAFSRGGEQGTPEPLLLPPLIKDALSMLRSVIPTTVSINVSLDESAPPVIIDTVNLQQIVMNLCINARDAMQGKGTIGIEVASIKNYTGLCASCHEHFNGSYVALAVRDNGHGIDEAHLKHLFDPFFTTKEVGRGTGMGLSVVHGIVHGADGHIVVDTRPGSGTEFRILFRPATTTPKSDHPEVATLEKDAVRRTGTILIVEDEIAVGGFLRELFENSGYTVRVFNDSLRAFEDYLKDPHAIDLMVTDQTMPGMTGLDLARLVHEARPDLPILLCTGYSEDVDRSVSEEYGIRRFFQKPIHTQALLDCVDDILEHT